MSVISAAVKHMLAAGLAHDQIVAAVEEMEAGICAPETADDRRKRLARDRTQRWRASRERHEASPTVTGKTVTEASPTVTERHEASPLARGLDNPLRLVDINLTTPDLRAGVSEPPTKAELDHISAELRSAGSPAIDPTAPRLLDLSPIVGLIRHSGQGPPCDFEADVLPMVRSRSKSARPGSVRSWDFFRTAIIEARDRRLSPNPEVENVQPVRPSPSPRQAAQRDKITDVFAAMEAAVGQRVG